ncbi:MAG TPA: carboxypeptidase-like regulatory domain-containing protein [Bacteroidia bacterium]|jgi:hypothetical protein|nr:carboxypeptidase-like regulatory domain-containing protein [Bacteroidia bacterium]HMU20095.1 carboxypeptidase-like regulatory domain-containing protein [Bacteroidia bacterium]
MFRLTCILLLLSITVNAQQAAQITGVISDHDTKEPLPGVMISFGAEELTQAVFTDDKGNFKIKPLTPGSYNIRFSMLGYETLNATGVRVSDGETVFLNRALNFSNTLPIVRKEEYRIPLMPRNPNTPLVVGQEDIKYAVDKNINALAASTARVFQSDAGEPISMSGSRYGTVKYIIDGVIADNEPKIPGCAIEQMSIYNSSLPACYGDATGGVIVITTKSFRF